MEVVAQGQPVGNRSRMRRACFAMRDWIRQCNLNCMRMSESSYVVLGLVDQRGPVTPYDLKQHIAESIGYFWDFPHSQLYAEPARLARLGLLSERREDGGRRRRIYTITDGGIAALGAWLDEPTTSQTEVRDEGLLKLFFSDGRQPAEVAQLAEIQSANHRARLAEYEALTLRLSPQARTLLAFRTLELGLRFEQTAIAFWEGVRSTAIGDDC